MGDYQYEDEQILVMRNLLMDEMIKRKSPYEFKEISYTGLSDFGDVYLMKDSELLENVKYVHNGSKIKFAAVSDKGYEIDYRIGAVQNPNNKSEAELYVKENTTVKAVFKKVKKNGRAGR